MTLTAGVRLCFAPWRLGVRLFGVSSGAICVTMKRRRVTMNFLRGSTIVTMGFMLAAVPAIGDSVAARPTSFQEMAFTLEGKITEHTSGKLTVSTEENIVFHVTYSDKTAIKRADGSAGSAKDFRTGVKIKVDGDLAESGEIAAKTIDIEAESGSHEH